MSDTRSLVYAINKFLRSEISEGNLPEEKVEGVEICIQCLERAYEIEASEPLLDVAFALQDMFQKCVSENDSLREPTLEEKTVADQFKHEGNCQMDSNRFEDAVASYTKAIKLDPTNPKYYCNRAAAFNNLGNYVCAMKDCEMALRYDPYYSKAYCRLGKAHSALNQDWAEAVRCYERAVELDPDNERYKECLKAAETSLAARGGRPVLNLPRNEPWDASYLLGLGIQMGRDLVRQTILSDFRSVSHESEQPYSNESPF